MGRSTNIVGRIIRNITKYDSTFQQSNKTAILDELNEAQKDLYTRVIVEKSFDITMVTDQMDYPLTAVDTAGDVIRDVITFVKPEQWLSEISFVPKREWDTVVKLDAVSTQPLYYSIFEKILKFFPTNSVDGETLTIWVNLKQPLTEIAYGDTDPEAPPIWDKALEFFVTAQFLPVDLQNYYMSKYLSEIDEKSATDFIINTSTQIGEAQ